MLRSDEKEKKNRERDRDRNRINRCRRLSSVGGGGAAAAWSVPAELATKSTWALLILLFIIWLEADARISNWTTIYNIISDDIITVYIRTRYGPIYASIFFLPSILFLLSPIGIIIYLVVIIVPNAPYRHVLAAVVDPIESDTKVYNIIIIYYIKVYGRRRRRDG